jgi:hypothetical protein
MAAATQVAWVGRPLEDSRHILSPLLLRSATACKQIGWDGRLRLHNAAFLQDYAPGTLQNLENS